VDNERPCSDRGEVGEGGGDGRSGEGPGDSGADATKRTALSHPHRKKRRRGDSTFYSGAALMEEAHDDPSEEIEESMPGATAGTRGYDRVLVDAECTHDGSIKHLAKFTQWGWETFERRFLDPERLTTLARLQAALLATGFGMLKDGGTLVYSTCSFARAQNEEIVTDFLNSEPRAQLAPIKSLLGAPCRAGDLEHTIRFEPRLSGTSGLFVAKITKLPLE